MEETILKIGYLVNLHNSPLIFCCLLRLRRIKIDHIIQKRANRESAVEERDRWREK